MDLIQPQLVVIALAIPSVAFLAMALRRLFVDWKQQRLTFPRWPALGLAFLGFATVAAALAVSSFTHSLSAAAPELASIWTPYFLVFTLEIGFSLAFLAAWLLDDAERRHRHLHQVSEDQDRRIRENERSFSAVVESAPAAVILVAPVGRRILAANDFAMRWLEREGESPRSAVLEDWLAPPHSDDPEQTLSHIMGMTNGHAGFVNFQTAEGRLIEAEVAGASVVFLGRPAIILIVRDVSDVEQARRAAEAASRAKNQFLTNVSHEIRTPLNGILGMTELALDASLSRGVRENLETAHRCARDLLLVVDDVLDFSRLEAGQLEINLVPFHPEGLVSDIVQHLAPRARARGLVLLDVPRRDLPQLVIGDAARIRQVMVNLVSNAIKFTTAGEISVRAQPVGRTDEGKQLIRFSVMDTGCGIAEELHEQIFEAFRQGDGSLTREHGGTGLGLALSRQLIGAMGGSLSVESTPGKGSTFSFEVSLRIGNSGTQTMLERQLAGRSALVIHPSSAIQASLSEKLLALGIRTRTVGELISALSIMEDAQRQGTGIDAVFVDASLGFATSASLLESARKQLGRDVPWVAVSARVFAETPASVVSVLVLPCTRASLEETLAKAWPELPAARSVPTTRSASIAGSKTVLVVEDNRVNRRLVVTLLKRAGYGVKSVENGEEAIAALETEDFSLVLMDVQMPVMDGLEATRILRRNSRFQSLPVIALTAHALAGDRDLCLAAGMNEYLTKPVRREELLASVRRYVGEPVETDKVPG